MHNKQLNHGNDTACVLKQLNILRRYLRKKEEKKREMKQEETNYQLDLI